MAIYNQYMLGMGGRSAQSPRRCAAESFPLVMRANTELRREPDIQFWQDHVYLHDFKEILERHMDPDETPTRADDWWPPPDGEFTHEGVTRTSASS